MTHNRVLPWEGCNNLRDLGGLRTADGRTTRWGALIRGDNPGRLTPAGWEALYAYGVRTLITLRTHGMQEDEFDYTPPYAEIAHLYAYIEDFTDQEFLHKWVATDLWGTPLYFKDTLLRWPQRHAAVVSMVAQAQPGGVLFHCVRGYDRTGIISLLLLGLAGVMPEDITTDYEMSVDDYRNTLLEQHHTTSLEVIRGTLDGFDLEAYLRGGGASPQEIAAVRQRLLG